MAKKKKAEEELKAPILRGDIHPDPEPPTNTNCNSYIVHDPDHELAMKVTDGTVDGVWLDGDEISGGGGGGSYEIWDVNVSNDSQETMELSLPILYFGDIYAHYIIGPGDDLVIAVIKPESIGTMTCGYAPFASGGTVSISTSGGVSYKSASTGWQLTVTGDGSIIFA